MYGWRDWLIRHRVTVAVAIVAAATGAAGTALALPAPSSPHVVSLPVAGRTQATLNVMSGTSVLDISVARLPGTLLRVSTPSGAPFRPVLSGSRPIPLSLAGDGTGPDQKNTGYAVTAGADVLDVTLPRPAGTLPFLFAGGASQFRLSLPGGVPARVIAGAGAGYLTVDGQSLTGVAGGTMLATPGWAAARARFDIDATAGVSRLTVIRW